MKIDIKYGNKITLPDFVGWYLYEPRCDSNLVGLQELLDEYMRQRYIIYENIEITKIKAEYRPMENNPYTIFLIGYNNDKWLGAIAEEVQENNELKLECYFDPIKDIKMKS